MSSFQNTHSTQHSKSIHDSALFVTQTPSSLVRCLNEDLRTQNLFTFMNPLCDPSSVTPSNCHVHWEKKTKDHGRSEHQLTNSFGPFSIFRCLHGLAWFGFFIFLSLCLNLLDFKLGPILPTPWGIKSGKLPWEVSGPHSFYQSEFSTGNRNHSRKSVEN